MLLETTDLTIGYKGKAIQSELNIALTDGALICLIGKNGCGKTTLLRTLAGIQRPLSGDVTINGTSVIHLSHYERSKLFSVVLTEKLDVDKMRVIDLVALGRFPHTNWIGMLRKEDKSFINRSIAQVNMTNKSHSYINELSDGEKQRAIIAKAITQDTPLVLLDEPTAHLDLPNRIEIMLLLRQLSVNTRKTFILSTHELELAMQMADQIWLMTSEGVQIGIPEDLMLNNAFQDTFGNDSFYFDPRDGHYVVRPLLGNLAVSVSGEEIACLWVKRALHRVGIVVDEDSATTIHAETGHFRLTVEDVCHDYSTIGELINAIFSLSHT